jgi:hypothetical protein
MKRILSRRPSPAMIIAIVALIAALAGTAVAGGGFLTKKKFKKSAVRGPVQYITTNASVPNATGNDSYQAVSATCPAGTKVVGGGIKIPDFPPGDGDVYADDSYPTATGWAGHVSNFDNDSPTPFGTTATTTAICVTVKSSVGAPPSS